MPDEENSEIYFVKSGQVQLYIENFKEKENSEIMI